MSGIKENKLILGFKSFSDFFDSILGLKAPIVNFFIGMFTAITSFVTKYIWEDAGAVYFLLTLILIDAATGVWKSVKYKTFRSSKLPRIIVIALIYVVMLATSWNAAHYSNLFIWLPGLVYGGLLGTQLVSIYENFAELGYLPSGLLYDIKNRINEFLKKEKDKNDKEN